MEDKNYELAKKAFEEIEYANTDFENLNFPGYLFHSAKIFYYSLCGIIYDIKKLIK
jgi:hypothetical protein